METIGINRILTLFNQLFRSEQIKVAEQISLQTFNDRWNLLDQELPDTELSEEVIMEEVRNVRYKKGK